LAVDSDYAIRAGLYFCTVADHLSLCLLRRPKLLAINNAYPVFDQYETRRT
jgi:hypothetical protein